MFIDIMNLKTFGAPKERNVLSGDQHSAPPERKSSCSSISINIRPLRGRRPQRLMTST